MLLAALGSLTLPAAVDPPFPPPPQAASVTVARAARLAQRRRVWRFTPSVSAWAGRPFRGIFWWGDDLGETCSIPWGAAGAGWSWRWSPGWRDSGSPAARRGAGPGRPRLRRRRST